MAGVAAPAPWGFEVLRDYDLLTDDGTTWPDAVGALFISARCGRPPGFASEAQVSWMIFSSRRFEKLDYSIEEQYRAQPDAWTRNQIELPWS